MFYPRKNPSVMVISDHLKMMMENSNAAVSMLILPLMEMGLFIAKNVKPTGTDK